MQDLGTNGPDNGKSTVIVVYIQSPGGSSHTTAAVPTPLARDVAVSLTDAVVTGLALSRR